PKGEARHDSLPGTRREVEAISPLFDTRELLFGSAAGEEQLDRLASSGRLARFRFVHLATHAEADDRTAMRSALILAQARLPDRLELALAGRKPIDGRLTAEEILKTWKLDAEIVTLSDCGRGLG